MRTIDRPLMADTSFFPEGPHLQGLSKQIVSIIQAEVTKIASFS